MRRLLLLLPLCIVLVAACARPREIDGYHMVVLPAAGRGTERPLPVVFAEIASTRDARARGLGDRRSLPPDGGMLFVYRDDAEREFWMKDCLIGLDIAFLKADGTIAALATLPAPLGKSHEGVPRARSGVPVRYVLETESGWMAAHGIRTGDRVDVRQAARGVIAD